MRMDDLRFWRQLSRIASAMLGRGSVPDDAHTFYRHERPTGHHLIEHRQELVNVCLVIDDFNQQRQMT